MWTSLHPSILYEIFTNYAINTFLQRKEIEKSTFITKRFLYRKPWFLVEYRQRKTMGSCKENLNMRTPFEIHVDPATYLHFAFFRFKRNESTYRFTYYGEIDVKMPSLWGCQILFCGGTLGHQEDCFYGDFLLESVIWKAFDKYEKFLNAQADKQKDQKRWANSAKLHSKKTMVSLTKMMSKGNTLKTLKPCSRTVFFEKPQTCSFQIFKNQDRPEENEIRSVKYRAPTPLPTNDEMEQTNSLLRSFLA